MSNLKKNVLGFSFLIVVFMIAAVFLCDEADGAEAKPKALRDFMYQPPNSVYAEYGYGEETFLLFNIIKLKEVAQVQDAQIKELRAEVDELKKVVAELMETTEVLTVTVPLVRPTGLYCMNDSFEYCGMPDIKCLKHPFDPCKNTDPRFRRFGRQVPAFKEVDPNEVAK